MNRQELATRLLATFVGELEEQVSAMNADLLALEACPDDPERVHALFRAAHTIKGAARAVGVSPVEQACHALESLLVQVRDGGREITPDDLPLLFAAADALGDSARQLRSGQSLSGSLLGEIRSRLKAAATPDTIGPRIVRTSGPSPASSAERPAGQLRVQAAQLDALLASSGQLQVATSRVSSRTRELELLREWTDQHVAEWSRTDRRVRLALERGEAAPALVPALSAMREGFRRLSSELGRLAAGGASDARSLVQASEEVADRVGQVRVRPFAEAGEALPRMVRDLAAAAGKEVDFELTGGEIGVDRGVLAGLRELLVPLIRNAVDHGIEVPAVRKQRGKPDRGKVRVAAALAGDRLTVTVADDGNGLDAVAIRAQLARHGVAMPVEDRDLARALFGAGLSTLAVTTEISGRGVGLDIVRATLERIRGSVDVSWIPGGGTTFTVECPPTLAAIRAVLAVIGTQRLAFPTASVERLVRVRRQEVRQAGGRDGLSTSDGPVPLVALARLLPPLVARPPAETLSVVLLRAGDRRVGVIVDELLAEQTVVLQPVARTRRSLPLVSGAALHGVGHVVLVLNPAAIVTASLDLGPDRDATVATAGATRGARQRILVVDDSITTRTLEQSILESAGYDVITAVDGADAWKTVQERGCDLLLSDIEMPRMDGFALCEAVRGSTRFKALPVVLVTALETSDDRARGLRVGADAYIGKSAFDQQQLLDTIRQLVGQGAA